MKYDISKLEHFCEPFLSLLPNPKGMKIFICFLNLGAAGILGIQSALLGGYIFAGIGILLSVLSFIVREGKSSKKICAWYGFCEIIYLLILCYWATYQEYVESGLNLRPYMLYTQLIGWCITIIFIPAFTRRLKLDHEDKEITEKSIIYGYIGALALIVIVFGGLIILYYTVFNKSINLVESSKMLFCAFGIQIVVAYYGIKVYMLTRYGKLMYKTVTHKKRRRK